MGTPTKKVHGLSGRGYAASLMIAISGALVLGLGATESQAHPHKQDIEALAGAAPAKSKIWKKSFDETITVNGKTYDAVTFSVNNNGDNYSINGKKYPSKYSYSVYSRNGQDYVVKQKNGKKYMEIGDNWYRVDETNFDRLIPSPPIASKPPKYTYAYAYKNNQKYKVKTKNKTGKTYVYKDGDWQSASTSGGKNHGHRHVKIDGKWINIDTPKIAPPAFPAPPVIPSTWINEEVRQRVEEAVERKVEAAVRAEEAVERQAEARIRAQEGLVRADERRERNQERAEAKLERSFARAERNRERAEERRQDALERVQEQREAVFERAEFRREQAETLAEKQRAKNENLNDRYEIMRVKLTTQLKRDGYLTPTNTQVTMEMTPTDIFINGKQLDDNAEGKYCKILSVAKLRKDGKKRIIIKPGYFHITNKGDGHNTTYTHND